MGDQNYDGRLIPVQEMRGWGMWGNVRKSVESRDSHLTYSTMLFSA
jgi:hypothetical protein